MSLLLETAIKVSLVPGLGLVAVMLLRRGSAACGTGCWRRHC